MGTRILDTRLILIILLVISCSVFGVENNGLLRSGDVRTLTDQYNPSNINSKRLTVGIEDRGFYLYGWNDNVGFSIQWDIAIENYAFVRQDGNFEWAFMVDSGNSWTFPMESYGVDWFAQGFNDPNMADSVVGSYAVYRQRGWGNEYKYDGAINAYKTGKLCHIYRPYAYDVMNDTVWVDMIVTDSTFELSLPDWWCPVYPVVVDPQFGKTSAGATQEANGGYLVLSVKDNFGGGTGSDIDSIVLYGHGSGTSGAFNLGVYNEGSDRFADDMIRSANSTWDGTSTPKWYQLVADNGGGRLKYDSSYWMGSTGGANTIYYDGSGGALGTTCWENISSLSDPFAGATADTSVNIYSTYITYTDLWVEILVGDSVGATDDFSWLNGASDPVLDLNDTSDASYGQATSNSKITNMFCSDPVDIQTGWTVDSVVGRLRMKTGASSIGELRLKIGGSTGDSVSSGGTAWTWYSFPSTDRPGGTGWDISSDLNCLDSLEYRIKTITVGFLESVWMGEVEIQVWFDTLAPASSGMGAGLLRSPDGVRRLRDPDGLFLLRSP